MDPGSARQHHLEVQKRTLAGDVTVLRANVFGHFAAEGLIINAAGHVLAIANLRTRNGSVLFDLTSNTHLPVVSSYRGSLDLEVMDTHQILYAASGSGVYGLSPTGEATQLAELHPGALDFDPSRHHLALAPDGRLLISDATLNVIETMTPAGLVTPFAGTSGRAGSKDGIALRARFNSPRGLAVGRDGSVFVADAGNHTIRRIDPNGNVSTIAGKPGKRATVDGRRAAARLDSPDSIAIDSTGSLYVTNGSDNLIRKITPEGVVSTVNVQIVSRVE